MNKPTLLTETPRAGSHGHRFILPNGLKMKAAKVENFLSRAADQLEGRDYLAANHLVEQQLPNGAIRRGKETIVLANVNVKALSDERKETIKKLLNTRLADLSQLIKVIDWQADGRNTSVRRPEINAWLSAPELQHLPAANLIEISPLHAVIAGIILGLTAGFILLHLL